MLIRDETAGSAQAIESELAARGCADGRPGGRGSSMAGLVLAVILVLGALVPSCYGARPA